MLCDALYMNFKEYNIRAHQRSINQGEDSTGYHAERIQHIKENGADIEFYIKKGKRYLKVIMKDSGSSQSVHAFVDRETGDVYKAASWKAPAKHVRYDLRIIKDREYVLENCDWAGGYLYMS